MTARQQLVDGLTPLLPKRWDIVPYSTAIGDINVPTVMFNATHVEPKGTIARGFVTITYQMTVIEPTQDAESAPDLLEEELLTLLEALTTMGVLWSNGQYVVVSEARWGWLIEITTDSKKENKS